MPAHRIISDEKLDRLRQVAAMRWKTPSNKELAEELGVSQRTVEAYITRFMRDPAVSRGSTDAKIASV